MTPVLLIPGGAATSKGFFPRLPEALAGHPVVQVDRPGTGTAAGQGEATLAGGAAALAAAVRAVTDEPALVVGQSLGGAVAVQLAIDVPELVAGLVLLDPTPFSLRRQVRRTMRLVGALAGVAQLPLVGARLERGFFELSAKKLATTGPGMAEGKAAVLSNGLVDTAAAVRTLDREGAELGRRLRPVAGPVVVVTADRKPGSPITAWHEQLAAELGGCTTTWPGCVHAEQLRDPDRFNAVVLEALAEIPAREEV